MQTHNLRIQDAVARAAGVSLRNTVKVLRALTVVSAAEGEHELSTKLDTVLEASAQVDGDQAPLDERPGMSNIDACEQSYQSLLQTHFDGKHRMLNKAIDSDVIELGNWKE